MKLAIQVICHKQSVAILYLYRSHYSDEYAITPLIIFKRNFIIYAFMKSVCFLIIFTFFYQVGTAQKQQVLRSDTIKVLNGKVSYYRKKSVYLSKQTKKLSYQLVKLNNKNKRILFRVDYLVKDSLKLSQMLDSSYTQNTYLIKKYESKIQDMNNTLESLKDSMNALQIVKNDIGIIKTFLNKSQPDKKEYDLNKYDLLKILKDYFAKSSSPYELITDSDNQLVVSDTFNIEEKILLFFEKKVSVYGEYKINVFPNPFDKEKTTLSLSQSFRKKKSGQLILENDVINQTQKEKELLDYIDKAIAGITY